MSLGERELRLALHCCNEELRARNRGKPPGPQSWLVGLVRALELEVVTMSRSRQDPMPVPPCSEHEELVGSREAATILGWTVRQVQRHAADLDAQKLPSGQLVFQRGIVNEYREAMNR